MAPVMSWLQFEDGNLEMLDKSVPSFTTPSEPVHTAAAIPDEISWFKLQTGNQSPLGISP